MLLPILHLFNDGYLAAMPLVLPFAADEFGLTLSLVGLLGSLLSFSGIILALPAGAAATRFGTVKILSAAVLGYSLGFLLLGVAGGMISVILAFLLGSIAFGVFHPVAFSAVAKSASDSDLGRKMGFFAATGDIGKIALAAAITFIIGLTSWRATSILYGVIAFILFIVSFLISIRSKKNIGASGQKKKKKLDYRILKEERFALSNLASLLDSFANASLFIFIPFLLTFRGIEATYVGLFTSVYFVGNLLGKVLMGRLSDIIAKERLFIICEISIFTCLAALALTPYVSIILVLALLLGFFTKGTVPITSTMIAESVEKENFEAAYSINSLSTSVSNTVAPLFFGILADYLGIQAIFLSCGVVALIATLPAIRILIKKKVR